MKAKLLDQFYTHPDIAKQCLLWLEKNIPASKRKSFLEPSAGTGAFSNLISPVLAFDLHPKASGIKKKDFLTLKKVDLEKESSVVIGNPPFGKNSSLAIKFFNHSTNFADTIAFVVPRTFKKTSTADKLNPYFKKVFEKDLPKKSFIFEGQAYDVPCCFQIWVRTETPRKKAKSLTSKTMEFTTQDQAEFAVRRVGGRTGKAMMDPRECSQSSHYFLRALKGSPESLVSAINALDFSKEANSTAGVRSLSKPEFLKKIVRHIG